MDRDQVAYVPELFDIHVMAFADDSETTIRALQEIFHVERGDAERLIADAPVVVKRAATPDVADVLLDALQELGAQVVIMPSRARERVKPQPAPAPAPVAAVEPELELPPARSPATPVMPGPPPASANAANWGGLDFSVSQAPARRAAPENWSRYSSTPAALARSEEFEPDDDHANAEALELDANHGTANARLRAAFAAADRSRARAPAAEMSLPPGARKSLPGERQASLNPTARGADGFDHAPLSTSLSPASLAPAVRDNASLRPALPAGSLPPARPPVPKRAALPPPPPGAPPPRAARKPGVPPPPPPTDLGLGTVPPLPLIGGTSLSPRDNMPRRESPLPARTSFRPVLSDRPRFQHRDIDAGQELHLPRIDVSTPLLRPSPSTDAAAGAAGTKAQTGATPGTGPSGTAATSPRGNPSAQRGAGSEPSTRFATQRGAGSEPSTRFATQRGAGAEPSTRFVTEEGATSKKVEAAPVKPPASPARGRALLEIAAGVLVFYLGLHMDNTVLHGNASATWVVLHAFGLYAIGSGIAGLWP